MRLVVVGVTDVVESDAVHVLLQSLGIDCLSLVIVLWKQIKLQELIRPLS